MSTFTAINLSQLPLPDIIETLDYEVILAEIIADFQSRDPNYSNITESDPAYKIFETCAFRELVLRQRINDANKATTLAYATGDDLDVRAGDYNIERRVIDEGDPEAIPPVAPTFETDDELRRRVLLAFEGLNTAGSRGSYILKSLNADVDVKDASAQGPLLEVVGGELVSANGIPPGQVVVTVLSRTGDGTAPAGTLMLVETALNDDDVRPLTDQVVVQSATVSTYTIEAELTLYPGPDANVVRDAAIAEAQAYADDNHRLGRDIIRSGVFAALHRAGVQKVDLIAPAADIVNDSAQASFCTAVNVTVVGRNE